MIEPAPARVAGGAVVYRLFDVGYGIDLEHAGRLLAASVPERVRPQGGEAQALQIPNPPLTVALDPLEVDSAGRRHAAESRARIFDFGCVSLQLSVAAPAGLSWDEFTAFGNALDVGVDLSPVFRGLLEALLARIGPALERPFVSPLTEDYVVFRLHRVEDASGAPYPAQAIRDEALVPLLLAERRPLSESACREQLSRRFAYYEDELAVLTWDNALIVEPGTQDSDVQYLLEFANAQLLELRVYDAILEAELARMSGRIASLRAAPARVLRRHSPLLRELHTVVGDFTDLVERVENSLRVTDDVYLARVYGAALELFRGRAWRAGIDRKLAILKDAYTMMGAESQAARSELLELTIIALIGIELTLALLAGR